MDVPDGPLARVHLYRQRIFGLFDPTGYHLFSRNYCPLFLQEIRSGYSLIIHLSTLNPVVILCNIKRQTPSLSDY